MVDSCFHSRETSLYGWVTWMTSWTPPSAVSRRTVHAAVVAHQADGRPLAARHRARLVSHRLDRLDDRPDLRLPGVVAHDDKHQSTGSPRRTPTIVDTPGSCMVTP